MARLTWRARPRRQTGRFALPLALSLLTGCQTLPHTASPEPQADPQPPADLQHSLAETARYWQQGIQSAGALAWESLQPLWLAAIGGDPRYLDLEVLPEAENPADEQPAAQPPAATSGATTAAEAAQTGVRDDEPKVATEQADAPSPPVTDATGEPQTTAYAELEMVALPAGCFVIGSPAGEAGRYRDEQQRDVCVAAFRIGKFEITQELWQRVMGDNPSHHAQGGQYPVENVNWVQVGEFIDRLNQHTGRHFRLPTEAEWEYAARGGTRSAYWWGDSFASDRANIGSERCCRGRAQGGDRWRETAPVGSFAANPWGLFDTAGNVWEWTCSSYAPAYQGQEAQCIQDYEELEPIVLRGGSWYYGRKWARSAHRFSLPPLGANPALGLRLAEDLAAPPPSMSAEDLLAARGRRP
jgi:formylglycine-generating enzyme required for sulfatase activity